MTLGHERPRPDPDAWRTQAACKSHDPDLWFPDVGHNGNAGRAICRTCPVADACLNDALQHPHLTGIFADTDDRQRRALRRQRGIAANRRQPIRHGIERGYRAHLRRGEPACEGCLEAAREARRRRVA